MKASRRIFFKILWLALILPAACVLSPAPARDQNAQEITVTAVFTRVPQPSAVPAGTATTTPTVTVTPAAAVTTTPTSTATGPAKQEEGSFTLASISSVAPDEAMREMYVFGHGASRENCESKVEDVLPDRPLMAPVVLTVCWHDPDTTLAFWAIRPDGLSDSSTITVSNGEAILRYQPRYNAPAGKYRLALVGQSREIRFDVVFSRPQNARLLEVPPTPFTFSQMRAAGPRHNLILDHFVPGEKVRLFAYRFLSPDISLIGWQDYLIPSDGQLLIAVHLANVAERENLYFAAFGERTGEVHFQFPLDDQYLVDEMGAVDLICPGAAASRLKFLSPVRAAYGRGPLQVGAEPGFSSKAIAQLPEGTQIVLTGDVQCVDHTRFWKIRIDNRTSGWVAEADQKNYLVEPVK